LITGEARSLRRSRSTLEIPFVAPPWSFWEGGDGTGRLLSDVGNGLRGALVRASSSWRHPGASQRARARPATIDRIFMSLPDRTIMGALPET
jgi:hypothetical protein